MNIRKLTVSILAAMILGAAPAIAADPAKEAAVPKAVFAETSLNFPTVVDGVVVTREFTVKNFGSADLRIDKVKTG